ncbi:MAG TPA: hypothetical protein VN519_15720 [Bryobacteraceae bacterium]|nr:hypothetical protein [Bryobacteraceae bacterium]
MSGPKCRLGDRATNCSASNKERFMSEQKENPKEQSSKKEQQDPEGMAQGADTADPSSLKKQIDYEGQKPNQQKKAS